MKKISLLLSTIFALDSITSTTKVEILSISLSLREFEIADSKLISSAICLDETLTTYIPLLPYKRPDVSSSSNEKADPII